jgi:DNA-binding NarL/FixJ family response regulator
MNVVLLANDLMVISRLQSAAANVGARIHGVSSGSQALAVCDAENAALLIIDLATPGIELDFVQQLKAGAASRVRVVAFGPHVHKERLAAAQAAGCDTVASRGQFFSEVNAILKGAAS